MKKLSILASILVLLINFSAVAAQETQEALEASLPLGICTTTDGGTTHTTSSNCSGEWAPPAPKN